VAAAPPRRADANKAFVPPPDWTPPAASVDVAAAAPMPAPTPAPVPTPAPEPVVQQPVVQQPIVQQPVAPPVMATPAPTPPPPAAPLEANIPTAQSGAVPYKDIKSPPFDGNVQVAVIQFGRGSSGLGGVDYAVLQKVAEIQRSNRATVRVVAHSAQDAYGSSVSDLARANYEVSRRRALAIANQLVRLGVPADRIVAEAASDAEPVYETNTARGIAANRRAEIFVDF
jgi:outer membrane protein OmpA-like peptidoglycan-associated protein